MRFYTGTAVSRIGPLVRAGSCGHGVPVGRGWAN